MILSQSFILCTPGLLTIPLGLNGAAFANLGDMPVDVGAVEFPSTAREEGVKLGESTLRRFLTLRQQDEQQGPEVHPLYTNPSNGTVDEAAFPTSWLKAHPSPIRQPKR